MQRKRIPGVVDALILATPDEIRQAACDPNLDRDFVVRGPLLNRLMLGRILRILTFRGERFPTLQPRGSLARRQRQDAMWDTLNREAEKLRAGPPMLEPLAAWVRGTGPVAELGPLLQNAIAGPFLPSFAATPDTWAAALVIEESLRTRRLGTRLAFALTRRIPRAKATLAKAVGGDRSLMHGIGVAIHNIVKGLARMRDIHAAGGAAAQDVPAQCLFAPPAVLRQARQAGEVAGCPVTPGTPVVLALAAAAPRDPPLAFLSDDWPRCPADTWVAALMQGVWARATRT